MESFIAACLRPLRKSIRINTLKISVTDFIQRANSKGWELSAIPWCKEGFWIEADESVTPLGNSVEHMTGLFYIQEASSMLPVAALFSTSLSQQEKNTNIGCIPINSPLTILDMAAAPGSKTTQIAALMNNQGLLIANEYSASRIKVLHANIERCGIYNTALTNFDGCVFGKWLPEQFDAVLLDAPCSGEGIIRKDADAMKNWSLESIDEIATTQKALIESAFYALKPGGILVYSTCTLNHQENQQVCHHLKNTFNDQVEFESLSTLFDGAKESLTEEGFLHVYPQTYDCEGFFIAKIRKIATTDAPVVEKKLGKFPFIKATTKQAEEIAQALKSQLGIVLPPQTHLWLRDDDVWLFPTMLDAFIGEIRFSRMGIKIAQTHKNGYRWQHQVATALTSFNTQLNSQTMKSVTVSIDDAREWFMGRDIRPTNSDGTAKTGQGEVIVKLGNDVIGLGKWVSNRIKNGLPRELVRDKNLF